MCSNFELPLAQILSWIPIQHPCQPATARLALNQQLVNGCVQVRVIQPHF
jgi:hypothetical protein